MQYTYLLRNSTSMLFNDIALRETKKKSYKNIGNRIQMVCVCVYREFNTCTFAKPLALKGINTLAICI